MKKYLIILLLIVVLTALARFLLLPALAPAMAGQDCNDTESGQIPAQAERMFLDRVLADAQSGNLAWLQQVSTPRAVTQLQGIKPLLSRNYTITWRQNSGGLYQRQLQLDNGKVVLLTYAGLWPECPDLSVTEEEIMLHLQLMGVELLQEEDVSE